MARQIESDLYQALIRTEFDFVSRGTRDIEEIYSAVKATFRGLCDDSYFCSENCRSGNNQPEWKHIVRNAMQKLKKGSEAIRFTGRKGYWEFR
jgi:hypothetical protein